MNKVSSSILAKLECLVDVNFLDNVTENCKAAAKHKHDNCVNLDIIAARRRYKERRNLVNHVIHHLEQRYKQVACHSADNESYCN